jgi:hypothetical protein
MRRAVARDRGQRRRLEWRAVAGAGALRGSAAGCAGPSPVIEVSAAAEVCLSIGLESPSF